MYTFGTYHVNACITSCTPAGRGSVYMWHGPFQEGQWAESDDKEEYRVSSIRIRTRCGRKGKEDVKEQLEETELFF